MRSTGAGTTTVEVVLIVVAVVVGVLDGRCGLDGLFTLMVAVGVGEFGVDVRVGVLAGLGVSVGQGVSVGTSSSFGQPPAGAGMMSRS